MDKAFKVTIDNFQAIKHAELEFPIGVTTIVGASNSGKTSIIRAISSVLTNDSDAKSFIKYGEDKATVVIEDEITVKWTRTPKESFYEIGDDTYQKVGKTDLFELVEDTGFYRDEQGNIINIQDEWSILFPFDRTSSQLYKLFEGTFAINNSSDVLKVIKDDESSCKKTILDHSAELKKNEDKLTKLTTFVKDNPVDKLYEIKENLVKTTNKYSEIADDVRIVIDGIKILDKLKGIERKEFDLTKIEKLKELENDIKYIKNNIKIVKFDAKIVKFDFTKLSEYNEVNKDVRDLEKLLIEKDKLETHYKNLTSLREELRDKIKDVKICPLCKSNLR